MDITSDDAGPMAVITNVRKKKLQTLFTRGHFCHRLDFSRKHSGQKESLVEILRKTNS